MQIVCGHPWTIDGRWVVVGPQGIIFDPDNGLHELDMNDCIAFVQEPS